jgi:hypothetical protein
MSMSKLNYQNSDVSIVIFRSTENVVTFSLLSFALALHVRGPEGQVVPQQLHNQRRVLPPSGIGLKRAVQDRYLG